MSAHSPLIELRQVTKRYGLVFALRRMDLSVGEGEFVALFGPNGAGKSTLLKVLAALAKPDAGTVSVAGRGARGVVGYVSHQSLLYNDLTGLENLLFYGRLYGIEEPARRAREMLSQMGLERSGDQRVRGYSRGMKQRLALARALLHDPPLLLLDEPYTGLDQQGSRILTGVLQQLKSRGHTVILVTHNAREGLLLCGRVLIQRRGQIVCDASRDEVPDGEFEALYLGCVEGEGAGAGGPD